MIYNGDKLFSKVIEGRTKEDELILIESVLIEIIEEQRKVGRNQILSSIESEVKRLRN